MKNEKQIDSILLANWYLTKCKIEKKPEHKTELARKYLVAKVKEALFCKKVALQNI